MPAVLLHRERFDFDDGAVMEMVLWQLPDPIPGSRHHYKYRLCYGLAGRRIVGYDNERGKGDHCHLDGQELPYVFRGVDLLVEDFIAAVELRRAS